jgi:hypothetical protein
LADLLTDGVLTASNQQTVFNYYLFIEAVISVTEAVLYAW